MLASYEGRLLRLTLDRPEKRNALDSNLCHGIVQALEAGRGDPGIGAILIEAQGPVFCAGMDLEESLEPDAAARMAIHERLFTFGSWVGKPVVAAVQGGAIAGGAGIVANAHVAVAAEDAVFSLPEVLIGMWPCVIWRSMVHALGERRAFELSLTGRRFSAADALSWGLVHRLAPPAQLMSVAADLAQKVAELSPDVVGRGFRLAQETRQLDWADAARAASSLRAEMFASADFHEGVRAFREKRRPRWPSLEPPIR